MDMMWLAFSIDSWSQMDMPWRLLRCQLLQKELALEVKKGQLAEDRHGAEKEALEASLRNTHAQGQKDQHQALHAMKSSNVEKDRALQALSAMLTEMQIVVADLQKALAEQLSGFRSLTVAVRSLLKDMRPLDALQGNSDGTRQQGSPEVKQSQEKKLQELQLQLREANYWVEPRGFDLLVAWPNKNWSPLSSFGYIAGRLVYSKFFDMFTALVIVASLGILVFEVNADARCYPEYAQSFQDCPVSSLRIPWLSHANTALLLIFSVDTRAAVRR
eukprot:s133_g1.t1